MKALKAEIEVFKAVRPDPGGEPAALQLVRQLASAPAKLRDPTMILSALQNLSDVARCNNHSRSAEYEVILRQTRPITYRPEFGEVIIRLFGTKEETAVGLRLQKWLRIQLDSSTFNPIVIHGLVEARGGVRRRAADSVLHVGVPVTFSAIALHDIRLGQDEYNNMIHR